MGNDLAAFGDDDGDAGGADLVHEFEAVSFEFAGGDDLGGAGFMTIW